MRKNIVTLSLAAAVAIGFTGCFGGGSSLEVPNVKKDVAPRVQEIDVKMVDKVSSKGSDAYMMVLANKRLATPFECQVAYNVAKNEVLESNKVDIKDEVKFSESISSAMNMAGMKCSKDSRTVTHMTMEEMAKEKKDLHDLLASVVVEVQKIFENRDGFMADNKALNVLNADNVKNIEIAMISGFDSLKARYFPVGKIVLAGIDEAKLQSDAAYKSQFVFLVAHELVHAYALHTAEEMTKRAKLDVVVEVAINAAYKKLDANIQKLVNEGAEVLAKGLLTKADYDYDNASMKERSESMAAKALKGKADKLELIGVGLQIPQTTKLVIMERVSAQLGKPIEDVLKDAIALLSSDANNLVVESGAHPHSQEFEADALGLSVVKAMGLDTKAAISIFDDAIVDEVLKGKKATASHPKASVRSTKLQETGL